MSDEKVAAAFIAHLGTLNAAAYDLDDVPTPLPGYYTEVTVSRRFGGNQRCGRTTPTLYRATTRAVAKTLSSAREVQRRAAQVEGARITVDGNASTPIQFETAETIGADDGYYSGLTAWTFAI